MDAITMLKADHKAVEKLFKSFEKSGPRAHKTRQELVGSIIEELSVHAAVEEQVFYPAVREMVPSQEDMTLESLEEHHIVKWVLSELEKLDPEAERFEAKVKVLTEMVRHHVEEEEGEMFPAVRAALGRKALQDIGARMEDAKKVAPHRPHPRSPDTPPGRQAPRRASRTRSITAATGPSRRFPGGESGACGWGWVGADALAVS
jgi:hemerythrin superfamily protein